MTQFEELKKDEQTFWNYIFDKKNNICYIPEKNITQEM